MYKIYQEVNFLNGSKITIPTYCPNISLRRAGSKAHEHNDWNKVEYGIYTCSKCGCRMTIKTEFKEEEIND